MNNKKNNPKSHLNDNTKMMTKNVRMSYICPFCNTEFPKSDYNNGKIHNCRIFSSIMEKGFKKSKTQITPLANIFLMCNSKNIDFGDVCKKFYFYFIRELPDELTKSGLLNLFDGKYFYMFMSGILDCPMKKFFTPDNEIIDHLLSYAYEQYDKTYNVEMYYDKTEQKTTYIIENTDSNEIYDSINSFDKVHLYIEVSGEFEKDTTQYSLL